MEEFGGFDGKLHREAGENLMGIAVDYESHSVFTVEASLVAIEKLFVADFGGCGLMLDDS